MPKVAMQKLRSNRLILFSLFYIFTVNLQLSWSNSVKQTDDERCPAGYFLHTDGLCYPKVRKPCPFENPTTESPLELATTTVTQPPLNFKKLECPDGSIMMQKKCRKIICSLGEYYRGSCLQPVCPQGLVWRQKKCQKPGYLTTILEIENAIINEVIETPFAVANVNKLVYHTSTTTEKPLNIRRSEPLLLLDSQKGDNSPTATTTISHSAAGQQFAANCCKVFTPRLCKLYGDKWLCFNRKYERCDNRVCKATVVYLKPPEAKYEPPLLVMPPSPKLDVCEGNSCNNNSDIVDCSGCSSFLSKSCSLHCYRYNCPSDSCMFMDLYEYCAHYSGREGCLPTDGCLWDWC